MFEHTEVSVGGIAFYSTERIHGFGHTGPLHLVSEMTDSVLYPISSGAAGIIAQEPAQCHTRVIYFSGNEEFRDI